MNEFIKEHFMVFVWIGQLVSYSIGYFSHYSEIKILKRLITLKDKYIEYLEKRNDSKI